MTRRVAFPLADDHPLLREFRSLFGKRSGEVLVTPTGSEGNKSQMPILKDILQCFPKMKGMMIMA